MSAKREYDYEVESYAAYYGGEEQVKKIIDDCRICGGKLIFTHLADYSNLYIKEAAHCPECGGGDRRLLHVIN